MNKNSMEHKEKLETEAEKKICGHITKKGTPCKNRPHEDGHIYCKLHLEDEARELDRHEEKIDNERDDMNFLMNAIYNKENIEEDLFEEENTEITEPSEEKNQKKK